MSKTTVFSTQHILERAHLEIHCEREVGTGANFTMGQRILQHAWDHLRGIATCEDSAVTELHEQLTIKLPMRCSRTDQIEALATAIIKQESNPLEYVDWLETAIRDRLNNATDE